MDFAFVKAEGHDNKPNALFVVDPLGSKPWGGCTMGCSYCPWGVPDRLAAGGMAQTAKERPPHTRTRLFSSQPPFLSALVALLMKSKLGEETHRLSSPLPASLVLSAPINYKPIHTFSA